MTLPTIATPVSQLTGNALEWAVASILWPSDTYVVDPERFPDKAPYTFTTQWGEAGPLFDDPAILLVGVQRNADDTFDVSLTRTGADSVTMHDCPTILVGIIRCFVASRLGETIDVPNVLLS